MAPTNKPFVLNSKFKLYKVLIGRIKTVVLAAVVRCTMIYMYKDLHDIPCLLRAATCSFVLSPFSFLMTPTPPTCNYSSRRLTQKSEHNGKRTNRPDYCRELAEQKSRKSAAVSANRVSVSTKHQGCAVLSKIMNRTLRLF